jgi:4-carboxymuconolactone decarboxylase
MDKRNHSDRYDARLKTRRELLGAQWVDKSSPAVDDFNRLLNTYWWDDISNRPGLPHKLRSVLNRGIAAAPHSRPCAKEMFDQRSE